MPKSVQALLLIGIIGLSTSSTQFFINYGRAVWGNEDIWWTPRSLALPLKETENDFRLLISDELIQSHLERNSIFAKDQHGQTYQMVTEDIKVRLNNWHRVKASFLHSAIYAAIFMGISLACFIIGLVQYITLKRSGNTAIQNDTGGDEPPAFKI